MWSLALVMVVIPAIQAQWWGSAVYYRILVDSFRDGDGDGLGDIKGLTRQLTYVKALGADAVILSPVSVKSDDCSRPGVMDLAEIDQRFGTLEDFVGLLEKATKLELKVVITLPLQTVSTASEWFNSSAARVTGYEDRVVWREGTPGDPPPPENNITWSWSETREAYYGSMKKEALVNLCSDSVAAAFSAAQCAWLRRKASGVLLDPDFQLEACGGRLVKKMAAEAKACAKAAALDEPVILVETSLPPNEAAMYYADGGVGASSVLSNALAKTSRSAPDIALAFYAALLNSPHGSTPAWLTSDPKENRITTRYGTEMIDAVNLLTLVLPGAAIIYQGDELGAADAILEWATSEKCWPNQGLPSSAPFPWDDTVYGAFSSGEPWLPLTPNYRYANAKTEFANDVSHVGVVRVAAAMRKSPAMGPHSEIKRLNNAVTILRWGDTGSLIAVANVAKEQTEVQLSRIPGIPAEMTVAASSSGSSQSVGSHIATEKTLKLSPGEAVLLAGSPRHCGGPGPVDKIANKLTEGWQKLNKYFSS
ncbi:hypothetical protein O0L34_g3772 [Tuta absoluta]|nr:hypothetical protein O0L34_g3772 [Tuta absoluta]